MATVDVVGLYPIIPHKEISALVNAFNKRKIKDVSTKSLKELAEIVLKNNVFEFNDEVYRQLRGRAIGT